MSSLPYFSSKQIFLSQAAYDGALAAAMRIAAWPSYADYVTDSSSRYSFSMPKSSKKKKDKAADFSV
jgi:hypothetical protein